MSLCYLSSSPEAEAIDMENPKVLIIGASGYIGGSVLTQLQRSYDASIKSATYYALVRSQHQADILRTHGFDPILFTGLDDLEMVKQLASEYDIVLNMAISYNAKAAEAFIHGLSERKQQGKEGIYIHISGNSNLADRPITGEYRESITLSDTENVHEYQLYRESLEPYDQRTADIAVVNTGIAEGVKTFIVQPCNIFGIGTGLFNKYSIPFSSIMRMALKLGKAPVLGPGEETFDYVHISDLAEMYELLLSKILSGADLPSGERGIYFCENGSSTWRHVAKGVARAGVQLGALRSEDVLEISSLEHWAELASTTSPTLVNDPRIVEMGFAGRFSTQAEMARQLLGWRPKRAEKDFNEHFLEEIAAVIEMQKK